MKALTHRVTSRQPGKITLRHANRFNPDRGYSDSCFSQGFKRTAFSISPQKQLNNCHLYGPFDKTSPTTKYLG